MEKVNENQLPVVREWHEKKKILDSVKAEEMKLRKESISIVYGDEVKLGTHKAELPNNLQLSLSVSRTISVDKKEFDKYKAEMESKGFIGDDSVIKLEPKVSMKAYDAMSDQDKVRFADVFVHKTSSPSLKVEARKE